MFGGFPAQPGQFPWQVALTITLLTNQTADCGGSLIAPEWVLTAAHCVLTATEIVLQFGGLTLNPLEKEKIILDSRRYIIHPDYNDAFVNNDIALIRLPKAINYTNRISPIALPDVNQTVGAGVKVTVSGWGNTEDHKSLIARFVDYFFAQHVLNYAKLTTMSNTECGKLFSNPRTVISTTLCADGKLKQNSCKGDSGGPVVTFDNKNRATLVGVISFVSKKGCERGLPSGFVRTEPFRKWIKVYTGV